MLRGLQKVMDAVYAGFELARDLIAEILVALAACGILLLGWWGYRAAPYVTVSVAAGVLLFAATGCSLTSARCVARSSPVASAAPGSSPRASPGSC
ncbi:hypothetical protein [Asanoa sp. NPDC050611]|uniref:hypothetical protein n=1 Tax=Asanoa sp. NPDC050611 TaxID=3157098 RepID=UPI0033CF856A